MKNLTIFVLSACILVLVFNMCDQSTLDTIALPTLLICIPAMTASLWGMLGGMDF